MLNSEAVIFYLLDQIKFGSDPYSSTLFAIGLTTCLDALVWGESCLTPSLLLLFKIQGDLTGRLYLTRHLKCDFTVNMEDLPFQALILNSLFMETTDLAF